MSNYLHMLNTIIKEKNKLKQLTNQYPWLDFLYNTKQKIINLEHVHELASMSKNPVFDYVHRSLVNLSTLEGTVPDYIYSAVEDTLVWSETAKCGTSTQRKNWIKAGINIHIHNIGSAQLYSQHHPLAKPHHRIVFTLIATHGLIGQYIRGEVNLDENTPLLELVNNNLMTKEHLEIALKLLNYCIISPLSHSLWSSLEPEVYHTISRIVNRDFKDNDHNTLYTCLKKLRKQSIQNGEHFDREYELIRLNKQLEAQLTLSLNECSMWYVEPALQDFSFTEFVKILLLATRFKQVEGIIQLDFSLLMQALYYDHQGIKKVNLFKKRIFEKYLSEYSIEAILQNKTLQNIHVKHAVDNSKHGSNTFFFSFKFSRVTEKLIDFCIEAERAEQHFEKAILLLYDYFDFRRDQFD